MNTPTWQKRLRSTLRKARRKSRAGPNYPSANADLVDCSLSGNGVNAGAAPESGYRIVVNISSAHIPKFCRERQYKNIYDLETSSRIGKPPKPSQKRLMVDAALHAATGLDLRKVYFAAVELNGAGMGFYGDCCLVLRRETSDESLVILDRNSYDLIRDPLRSNIDQSRSPAKTRAEIAETLSGRLKDDLPAMAAIKVFQSRPYEGRLLTTGMISNGILEDEDYIEVLRPKSFGPDDILEVRISAPDVAVDERIRNRALGGPPPSHAELLWSRRRRVAEGRLGNASIPIRVVTTVGRSRT
jgi:hypothetical protein